MEVTRILAEFLIPGLVFNCWFLIALDTLTAGRFQTYLISPQFPNWLGNILVLLLVATSYFSGVLISSTMLILSRPFRHRATKRVEAFGELVRAKRDLLLEKGIATSEADLDNEREWYRVYEGLLAFVWRNADEYAITQLQRIQNRLILERSMVIPLLLLAFTFPFWSSSFLVWPANVVVGVVFGICALYTLYLNWATGFRLSRRISRLAWQYLEEIENQREPHSHGRRGGQPPLRPYQCSTKSFV